MWIIIVTLTNIDKILLYLGTISGVVWTIFAGTKIAFRSQEAHFSSNWSIILSHHCPYTLHLFCRFQVPMIVPLAGEVALFGKPSFDGREVSYVVKESLPEDAGAYTCFIENRAGKTSCCAAVFVRGQLLEGIPADFLFFFYFYRMCLIVKYRFFRKSSEAQKIP